MTWKYNLKDDGTMDIIDHEETVVETIQNNGAGFTIPDDIKDVMRTHLKNEFGDNGNALQSKYGQDLLLDMLTEDIEEK